MTISAKVPSPLRDSKEINQALDVVNTQVNSDTSAIALKAPSASPTFTTKVTMAFATASTAPVFNASKEIVSSAVTATELGYVHGQTGTVKAGKYTVVADDATANAANVVTGLSTVTSWNADVFCTNVKVTADAIMTEAAGTINVADGAVTYDVTAGDVIHWVAVGIV